MEQLVQTKKPSGLHTPWLRLLGHAAMGVAMGLAFALILMERSDIATAIDRGESQGSLGSVATLVLNFEIGATLTGDRAGLHDDGRQLTPAAARLNRWIRRLALQPSRRHASGGFACT
jgi:hypothetical protein